jgi:predicted nucleic acid-binding protein
MPNTAARVSFLDASALVKIHVPELGSDVVRAYFEAEPLKYTSDFCFYEALSLLKGLWKKGRRDGVRLTKDEYFAACSRLFAWHQAMSKRIDDLDFLAIENFRKAREIAKKCDLDLSDAFQILSVKAGYFSVLREDSMTVFVTADRYLAMAARSEGLRVWHCVSEPPP